MMTSLASDVNVASSCEIHVTTIGKTNSIHVNCACFKTFCIPFPISSPLFRKFIELLPGGESSWRHM